MKSWSKALLGIGAVLGALGCQPAEVRTREPDAELARTSARGEDRSALLEKLAQTEEEVIRWRTSARELRRELKRAREVHDGMSDDLTVTRRTLRRAEAAREQALLQEAALTRRHREVIRRVAERELERLRAERVALEAEINRASKDPEVATSAAQDRPQSDVATLPR
ncbi:MAG: hypothetical protein JKY65_32000 [Planctomycetes bacterium]|nr:hypothetical protein [Planctomycetota bacterium]